MSDGNWHHACFTWNGSNGIAKAYKDGVFQNEISGILAGQLISPSGIWIVGQDQDSFGGGFERGNAFQGSLTDIDVWDRVLDAREISTLANERCGLGKQGNYRAYKDFVTVGPVQKVKPSCCQ